MHRSGKLNAQAFAFTRFVSCHVERRAHAEDVGAQSTSQSTFTISAVEKRWSIERVWKLNFDCVMAAQSELQVKAIRDILASGDAARPVPERRCVDGHRPHCLVLGARKSSASVQGQRTLASGAPIKGNLDKTLVATVIQVPCCTTAGIGSRVCVAFRVQR